VGIFLMITRVETFAMVSRASAPCSSIPNQRKFKDLKPQLSLDDETRALLKQKINQVGSLSEREVDTLTAMIKALWRAEIKKDP
jgi:hypothetical protein